MPVALTFGPDVDRVCFNVSIVDDSVYELREDFFVNLTTAQPFVTLMPVTSLVMIDDEDGKLLITFLTFIQTIPMYLSLYTSQYLWKFHSLFSY